MVLLPLSPLSLPSLNPSDAPIQSFLVGVPLKDRKLSNWLVDFLSSCDGGDKGAGPLREGGNALRRGILTGHEASSCGAKGPTSRLCHPGARAPPTLPAGLPQLLSSHATTGRVRDTKCLSSLCPLTDQGGRDNLQPRTPPLLTWGGDTFRPAPVCVIGAEASRPRVLPPAVEVPFRLPLTKCAHF